MKKVFDRLISEGIEWEMIIKREMMEIGYSINLYKGIVLRRILVL